MRHFRILLFAAVLITAATGCQQNYGKEYKLDKKHNVYYKGDGVEEVLAKKLAAYLKEQEYFQDSIESTVQLVKTKDTFHLNFVVDATKLTEGYENKFLLFGGFISEKVFDKKPVVIQLTNNKLEPFKNLGYAKPISDFAQ
ncbi:MAG TPA: hypothetical protein PLZ45_08415 [Ferruginibacter sp.]|nr:hypothetical protein [Chitinophagaceae bacterium]HRI24688.1 hypothetical protein [Ferruginibacter sp.]